MDKIEQIERLLGELKKELNHMQWPTGTQVRYIGHGQWGVPAGSVGKIYGYEGNQVNVVFELAGRKELYTLEDSTFLEVVRPVEKLIQ
jgi:hypothetical protein